MPEEVSQDSLLNAYDEMCKSAGLPLEVCGSLRYYTGWLIRHFKIEPKGQKCHWVNGDNYEYEFAYCSKCGHMEYAGWYTHSEAKEKIGSFHEQYKFCPQCGAEMDGGIYHERKKKRI